MLFIFIYFVSSLTSVEIWLVHELSLVIAKNTVPSEVPF